MQEGDNTVMKKSNIHKFLYAVSAFLVLGFAIRVGVDIYKYNNNVYFGGSAPLYAYVLIRVAEFIVPSIIIFIVALITKKKISNKK